jgi:hypothetical protein
MNYLVSGQMAKPDSESQQCPMFPAMLFIFNTRQMRRWGAKSSNVTIVSNYALYIGRLQTKSHAANAVSSNHCKYEP